MWGQEEARAVAVRCVEEQLRALESPASAAEGPGGPMAEALRALERGILQDAAAALGETAASALR